MAPTNESIRVIVFIHGTIPPDELTTQENVGSLVTKDTPLSSTEFLENNTAFSMNGDLLTNFTDEYSSFNVTKATSVSSNWALENETNMSLTHSNISSDVKYGVSPLIRYSYEFSLFTFFVIILGVVINVFLMKFLRYTNVSLTFKGGLWYSMAVCNLLVSGLVSVLLFLALSREEWPLQGYLCHAYIGSLLVLTAFSNNCAALMIIERYIFIRKKSQEAKKNPNLRRQSVYIDESYKKYTALLLGSALVWSTFLGTPPIFGWSDVNLQQERLACYIEVAQPRDVNYFIVYLGGSVVLPVVGIASVYYLHKKTIRNMTVQLQTNRHRSSVVKLAMRVTKASTTSVPRKSISSLSSVIIKDTQNYIRNPLTQEIHKECHLLRQHIIWGSVGIATSMPYIITAFVGSVLDSVAPESTIVASLLFMCNPIIIPIIIATQHDVVRKDMKKFLTDQFCFIADDVVPTAVVAPTAYRSGSVATRRESAQSRRKSAAYIPEEDMGKKPERRRSSNSVQISNHPDQVVYYGRPALTPIIERPSTSNYTYTPSPHPSPSAHSAGPSPVHAPPHPGRKAGMVVPPRREELDQEEEDEEELGGDDEDAGEPRKGRGSRVSGESHFTREDSQSTGGRRTHPLSSDMEGDMPQIS